MRYERARFALAASIRTTTLVFVLLLLACTAESSDGSIVDTNLNDGSSGPDGVSCACVPQRELIGTLVIPADDGDFLEFFDDPSDAGTDIVIPYTGLSVLGSYEGPEAALSSDCEQFRYRSETARVDYQPWALHSVPVAAELFVAHDCEQPLEITVWGDRGCGCGTRYRNIFPYQPVSGVSETFEITTSRVFFDTNVFGCHLEARIDNRWVRVDNTGDFSRMLDVVPGAYRVSEAFAGCSATVAEVSPAE